MRKIIVGLGLIFAVSASASVITNFWADFEGATAADLDLGTPVGSWSDYAGLGPIDYSTNGDYYMIRMRTNVDETRTVRRANFASNAALADEVHLSLQVRAHSNVASLDRLELARNLVEFRNASDDSVVFALAFSSVNDGGANNFTRMEYDVGDGWVTATDSLQPSSGANNIAFDAAWNHVTVLLTESAFTIQYADTRTGVLNTVVDELSWNPGSGIEVGSLYLAAWDANEEARRVRYDDILVTTIPEPGSMALIALGFWGLIAWRRLRA